MNDKEPHEIQREIYSNMFQDRYCNIIEKMIKYEFPNIKNLEIVRTSEKNMSITFDDGVYTKEEVERKIKEYRDRDYRINMNN